MTVVGFPRVLVLATAALLITGCGVRLRDPEPGTEFFTDIEVSGEASVMAPLTVTVGYEQFYPAEVELVCELRQNKQTLRELGRQLVPALENGEPEATPVVGHATFDFTVDASGSYDVECLTPKDEDNYIAKEIIIAST